MPDIKRYESGTSNESTSNFFPIDKFDYKENSEDYYFFEEVRLKDTYWIGSSSYKDFAAENSFVDFMEDVSESTVFLDYYFLKDNSQRRIKELIILLMIYF